MEKENQRGDSLPKSKKFLALTKEAPPSSRVQELQAQVIRALSFDYTAEVEQGLGYTFRNKLLLTQAFTRSSYAAEVCGAQSNEVLEFFGDTVLSQAVVKLLGKRYLGSLEDGFVCSDMTEKEYSEVKVALVQGKTLAQAMQRLGWHRFLKMGQGDVLQNVQEQPSVQEDLLEAILGAVALDSQWDQSVIESVVERLLCPDALLESDFGQGEANVAALEEWWQKTYPDTELVYKQWEEKDAELPHNCHIFLGHQMCDFHAMGAGKTPLGAKYQAAKRAMARITFMQKRNEAFSKVLKGLSIPHAINQLQELWQKGLIDEPIYDLQMSKQMGEDGNPIWLCGCRSGEFSTFGMWHGKTKTEAKRYAAMEMLMVLQGIEPHFEELPGTILCKGEDEPF